MKPLLRSFIALAALTFFPGCESTDGGGAYVSGSAYYGVGFYDPWYYGDHDYDVDVIVNPPPGGRPPDRPTSPPPRPTHPIAPAPRPTPRPTPMPSIPRTPMPRARGR